MKHRNRMHLASLMFSLAGLPFSARSNRLMSPDPDPNAGGGGGGGGGGENPDLVRARQELLERDAQIAEMNKKIEALSKDSITAADRKELEKLKKDKAEAETKRLYEQGELQKLLDKTNADLSAAQQELAKAKADGERQVWDLNLSNFFDRQIPLHTEVPVAQVVGALGLRSFFQPGPQGGLVVIDPSTKTTPRGPKGAPMTAEEFIASRIAETPWLAAVKPKGGSGSKSVDGGGSGVAGEFTSDDVSKMTTEQFIANRDKIFAAADANTKPTIAPLPKK